MRRKMTGKDIVKKAIVWAMAFMITFSTAAGTVGTITAQANEIDDYGMSSHVSSSDAKYHDDEAKKSVESKESTKEIAESAKEAVNAAAQAAEKVEEVKSTLGVSEAVKTENGTEVSYKEDSAIASAQSSVGTESAGDVKATGAYGAVAEAEKAAEDAKAVVEGLDENLAKKIDQFNNAVSALSGADSKSGNAKLADGSSVEVTGTEVVTEDAEGNTTKTSLEDFTKEQAETAAQAAEDAKKALENALAVDTKEVNDEVRDYVKDAVDAATSAQQAAANAQNVYDQAAENLKKAVSDYNTWAVYTGAALYDGTAEGVSKETYAEALAGYAKAAAEKDGDAEKKWKAVLENWGILSLTIADINSRGELSGKMDDTRNADLAELGESITSAEEVIEHAQDALRDAEGARDTAKTALELICKKTETANGEQTESGLKADAQAAADKTENYYVEKAQAAKDAADSAATEQQKKTEAAKQAAEQAEQKVIAAEQNAKPAAEQTFETIKTGKSNAIEQCRKEVAEAQKSLQEAKDKQDSISGWRVAEKAYWAIVISNREKDLQEANKAQQKAQNEYNTFVANKDSFVAGEIAKAQDVVNAKNELRDKLNAKSAEEAKSAQMNEDAHSKELALTAAQKSRDDYMSVLENSTKKAIVEALDQKIRESADIINQTEYDRALNDWANSALAKYKDIDWSWKFWEGFEEAHEIYTDAKSARGIMDAKYDDSFWRQIFNHLEITEWAVSKKADTQAMEALEKSCRDIICSYQEQKSFAEAFYAAKEAGASYEEALAMVADATGKVSDLTSAMEGIGERLEDAQNVYDKAEKDLKELKDAIRDKELAAADLNTLMQQIKVAEAAVNTAEVSLNEAKAQMASAASYAGWAESLVKAQKAGVYRLSVKDQNGQDVKLDLKKALEESTNGMEPAVETANVSSLDLLEAADSRVVPYEIYRAYVQAMYEVYNYNELTTGQIPEDAGIDAGKTMPVLLWEVDENNNLTGAYITEEELKNLQPGEYTYFVGYNFAHGEEGYQLTGAFYTFNQDAVSVSRRGHKRTATPVGDVLGAKREDLALLADSGEVLGAARAPKTGDDTKAILWMLVMGGSALGAAALLKASRKKSSK